MRAKKNQKIYKIRKMTMFTKINLADRQFI